jgi:tetratricopeptide (TPR) repeat protein
VNIDLDTFRKFLKAHELRDRRGPQAREAIPLYMDVIRANPNYAPALAELAATYGYLGIFYPDANKTYMRPAEAAVSMSPLLTAALEMDPTQAEAHAALGEFSAFGLRWAQAEASFRKAIELDPTGTHLYSDFVLSTLLPLGKLDEATRVIEKALEIDPLSLDARRTLSNIQLRAGRYADALENCRQVLAVDPNFPFAHEFCRWAQLFNGERAEALAQFEEIGRRLPGVRGWAHAIKGERAQAEAIAAQFHHLPQRQAEIYGLMGDTERALEALGRLALMNPLRAGYELTNPAIGLQKDPRATAFRRRYLGFPE